MAYNPAFSISSNSAFNMGAQAPLDGGGAGSIQLIKQGKLSPLVTFTRGSSGTYFDVNGVLRIASANEERVDYKQDGSGSLGLLIESSRVQQVRNATDFTSGGASSTTWAEFGGTAAVVTDSKFSGVGEVVEFTEDTSTGAHALTAPFPDSPSVNTDRTLSIFAKAGTATKVALNRKGDSFLTTDDFNIKFDLSNGTIIETLGFDDSGIEDVGGGWYRVWGVDNITTITGFRAVSVQTLDSSDNVSSFTGTSRTFQVFCPQSEDGVFPTSAILNDGVTEVTRATDICSVDISSSPWFNSAEGTVYSESLLYGAETASAYDFWNINDGTTVANTAYFKTGGGDNTQGIVEGEVSNTQAFTINTIYKGALGYKSTDNNFYVDGTELGTAGFKSKALAATQTTLDIGNRSDGLRAINGLIIDLRYYSRRLTDLALQELTS